MSAYPVRYRVPTQYSTAIGRLITRFAALESALRRLIYALLQLTPQMGRVAVRNPRIENALTMIQDLMALRGFTTTIDMKLVLSECRKLEHFRDKVAHGVWVSHHQTKLPVLQVTGGSYAETPGGKSVKARIQPKAERITLDNFRDYTRGIDNARRVVMQLAQELGTQHAALQKTLRGQSEPGP